MPTPTDTEHLARHLTEAAAWQGLVIPPACLPGVLANLAILQTHAARVIAAAGHAPPDPAELLAP